MEKKKNMQWIGAGMLLLTAIIWGAAFVAQSVGMESVEAFTFTGIRTLMGAVVLLPFLLVREKKQNAASAASEKKALFDRHTILCGILLGVVFCIAQNFQQLAFNYSTAGKIAFITALYMFFVPVFSIFLHKRVSLLTWICVVFGFIGVYFLSVNPSEFTGLNKGDVLAFFCAVFFALQILLIERFSDIDAVKLSFIEFLTSGILSVIIMFLFEHPTLHAIRSAIVPLLYSGVLSCGVAYTLQVIGQKYTEATIASLLMSMESFFAVVFSALLLGERLSGREIFGCAIMFAAILLSQISELLSSKIQAGKAARKES